MPLHQAQFTIPIMREQVESTGKRYRQTVLAREIRKAPPEILERMRFTGNARLAWVESLHLANDRAFALERRWVNLASVPEFEQADLTTLSANEWLVRTVPFSNGEVALSATAADRDKARLMGLEEGEPLFTMERTTWLDGNAVTTIMLYYPNGYRLEFTI